MRFPRTLLPVLFLFALLGACKKDAPAEEIDFGPSPGFQYRSGSNLPTSSGGDPTDWVADGPWNNREKQLFSSLNLSLDGAHQSGTWFGIVYPNPSEAATGFNFLTAVDVNKAPANSRISYVIVDRHYAELKRAEIAPGTTVSFAPNTLAAGALYRLYYVCYVPGQQVYFRSHGDIKVE